MAQSETPHGDMATGSRALIAMKAGQDQRNQPNDSGPSGLFLPDAGFLAQIIASAGHMGHFRRYRRTEPALAMRSYRSAANLISAHSSQL